MDVLPQGWQLNWIDVLVLLLVLANTMAGLSRGFIFGAVDVGAVAASVGAAFLGYGPVSAAILQVIEAPAALAILSAFIGLFLLAEVLYEVVIRLLFHLSRPLWLMLWPLAPLDRGLGLLPGAVKGLLFATLLLLPFAMAPVSPPVAAAIERSTLGSRLVSEAVGLAPQLEALLGHDLPAGLAFLTPPQTEVGIRLPFRAEGPLTPDQESEAEMLEMVNRERTRAGLRPLRRDEQLRQAARAHSREMLELGYFSHTSPEGSSPADRAGRAGARFAIVGENLAYAPTVQIAHEGLMNSPGHRANILRAEFGRVGIGVIRSQRRGLMFTQEFAD